MRSMDVAEVRADLLTEQEVLDDIVAALTPAQWDLATASPRWSVRDQIAHLTYFDNAAATAIADPEAFAELRDGLTAGAVDGDSSVDDLTLGAARTATPAEVLEAWRAGRRRLADAGATLGNDTRIEWYGPSMGSKSFLTARLMEVWAHGQDVIDAVGATRAATDRLRHIAQLGVITRGWSYVNRGLTPPEGHVRVELTSPSGETWTWGPEDAQATVRGPAEDFCLVVTQRRHPGDTALVAEGEIAEDWLSRAQAFAGPPTDGPAA